MTQTLHYRSNLRDILFNLFEVLDIGTTSLGKPPFDAMDQAVAAEALRSFERLCTAELQKSFVESDRVPLALDDRGEVTIPDGLKAGFNTYYDADCHRLGLAERMGGMGAPPSVAWGAFEMLVGSNPALSFYLLGTFAAKTIDEHGTEDQKRRFIPGLLDRRWGATMVLTEPDAGSDVGAARARARQVDGELWEIEGVKRFITSGDFDGVENILHLVLARPEGAPTGTKGLSLFLVPKRWVDEHGDLQERNGAVCTKIEKKMGIKGSVTCEMTFGDGVPARGLLLGGVHDGIRQMFHLIEQARMAVGIKSAATLSTAYLNALDYARERVQGPDLLRASDKSSPRVPIIRHPDVRRMLMSQKAHAEGMRALCLFAAWVQDQVEIAGGHGAAEAAALDRLNDMLLPIVKGYCSDRAYGELALALQTFGGSGYVQDFPIEQYVRDQKIDSLYEGTTHIQALDLLFRKIARDGGATLEGLLGRIEETIAGAEGGDELAPERAALSRALGDVRGIFGAMMGKMAESLYHAGLQGNRILFALADLVVGWLLVRQAAAAIRGRAARPEERAFYDGKIASARWFAREVLPGLTLARKLVEQSALDVMQMPDDAF
ncbi:MAG: acyl-CoA dehydrogenase [Polyangiaceae bacterium]|nr:acyl-CoA dehydrogenase [Polyangiaceae bacterium]